MQFIARSLVGCVIVLLAAGPAVGDFDLLYDVDFGSPPHTVGSVPVVGETDPAPRKVPTLIRFGDPIVVAAMGAMTEQPCAFGNGTTGYDQLQFNVDPDTPGGFPAAYPVYRLEVDLLPEMLSNDALVLFFDCPSTQRITFYNNGEIQAYFGNPALVQTIGTYTQGVPVHLDVELDVVTPHWKIWLDGVLVMDDAFYASKLSSFRFNLTGHDPISQAAVDNVRLYGGTLPPWSDLLYDIDFCWPPHQTGLAPVLGAGLAPRKVPTEIVFGDPTVVPSLGALSQQPCAFGNGTAGYDQLKLYVDPVNPLGFPVAYDVYRLSAQVLVDAWGGGDSFKLYCDCPTIHYVEFNSDGTIYANQGAGVLGTYSLGVPVQVMIEVDVALNTWTIFLDGTQMYTGAGDIDRLGTIRCSLAPGQTGTLIAVDDIYLWGLGMAAASAPEPDPMRLAALRVFPNPSGGEAWVRWAAPTAGPVRLEALNVEGRRVWAGMRTAASGQVRWEIDASLPDGVYFLRALTGNHEIGRQMLILQR